MWSTNPDVVALRSSGDESISLGFGHPLGGVVLSAAVCSNDLVHQGDGSWFGDARSGLELPQGDRNLVK